MKPDVASYDEVLAILTKLARGGDVRAAVALAGHLRDRSRDPVKARRDELRARREARDA